MQNFVILSMFLIAFTSTLLSQVKTQNIPKNDEKSTWDQFSHQFDNLKLSAENQRLRLDVISEQQQNHYNDIVGKLQNLDQKFERLLEQQRKDREELKAIMQQAISKVDDASHLDVLTRGQGDKLIGEFQKVGILQEVMLKKLDTQRNRDAEYINELKGCAAPITQILDDFKTNLTLIHSTAPKLSDLNEQLRENVQRLKKSDEITHSLLRNLTAKEYNQVCKRTSDDKMFCCSPNDTYPTSCADNNTPYCSADQCLISNLLIRTGPFNVTCDGVSDGGGWLVVQRRINGYVDFYRNWVDYKNGFGDLKGDFWLGLDKIHALTTTLAPVELLIQLTDHENVTKYAKYKEFVVGSEEELYKLKVVGDYEGTAGDSFSHHMGYKFTTKDKDNDLDGGNCAVGLKGGWWYRACGWSNLNGLYYKTGNTSDAKNGINWSDFHGYTYSLKAVQMMIRSRKIISN